MVTETEPEAPSRAGSLPLIGGALALDFVNTASGRGTDQALEHLRQPEHVVRWAARAGILAEADVLAFEAAILAGDPALQSLSREAVLLREALYRVWQAVVAGQEPAAPDMAAVMGALGAALPHARLQREGEHFVWRWTGSGPSPHAIFGPVASSALELLRSAELARIKCCPGTACGWMFYDLSKNRSRRWCEMQVCGNRAKTRRFRAERADD